MSCGDLAARKMSGEGPNQTLQTTALVHEAWLRLAGSDRQQWSGWSPGWLPGKASGGSLL